MDEIKELFELAKKEFSYKIYEELGASDEVKDATEMIVDELSDIEVVRMKQRNKTFSEIKYL